MLTASQLEKLSILVFEKGREETAHGCTAQCLELDIVSQGEKVGDAVYEVLRAVVTTFHLVERDKIHLPGRAPQETFKRFSHGKQIELKDFPGTDVRLDQLANVNFDIRIAA